MRRILANLRAVAATDVPVLFVGESGTGKRLLARHVHNESPRRTGRFVAVDCGGLPSDLLHSELFGHERGAFTGAYETRKGQIELTHGGSLFLDAITELPQTLQARLASFLEEGTVQRLGGNEQIPISSRVLAASQIDPRRVTGSAVLKPELCLHFLVVNVPPLRQRKDDIPILIDIFLKKYTAKYKKLPMRLTPEAQRLLVSHDYPGNVRELETLIEKAVVMAVADRLSPEDFPILETRTDAAGDRGMREVVHTTERTMVIDALIGANWVQTRAAGILGISERMLRYKMKKLGINREAE